MSKRSVITRQLEQAPPAVLNSYAAVVAFAAYFFVYAFRKPFTAATFPGLQFAGTGIELKTAFATSQVIGYTLAKYLGIKICSELSRSRRAWMIGGLILAAEAATVLFAVLPLQWKVAAMILNGFPLGIVWGLMVRYLEGRRTSDILLAGLACSFIVASGAFKDIGRAIMSGSSIPIFGIELSNPLGPLDQFSMPAATGMMFFMPFAISLWLLDQLPEPTSLDALERTEREPMDGVQRRMFLSRYVLGILPLVVAYACLTAFRDYRDFYLVDVLEQLGYSRSFDQTILTRMEFGVAAGVLVTMGFLYLIKNNERALMAILGVIAIGFFLMGVATVLVMTDHISGYTWAALIGLGGYMAYVPYNSVLFDRLMASTGFVGTAVFAIYVADSAGYTSSISVQIGKDLLAPHVSRLQFLEFLSAFVSLVGLAGILSAAIYFRQQRAKD